MYFNRVFPVCLLLIISYVASAQQSNLVPLKRKDSFFGLHFDFHAGKTDSNVGETLTEGMIDSLLTIVKPDFIQVDCKGHPGISSYPTKVGTPVKSFAKDPLRLWRQVTAKHGVALYVHYSGVYEMRAVELHPGWAAVNAVGKQDANNISVHSAYVDSLLIPQLKELSSVYGINGVWVDGDCWATIPDYSASSLKKFTAQTGITSIPHSDKDSGYATFMDFNRNSFLAYVRHYTDAIHQYDPNFQVASNWAFSSFMPQPVNVDVDFISGDLTPVNSVNSAAFEARCIAPQGAMYHKPWDLMSWGFTMNWDRNNLQTQKSITQLTQEAAEIIAMGGGFQCYFTQNRDASIKPWQIPFMKGLGDFMRPRREFCKGALPVSQIAVVYSGYDHYAMTESLFTNGGLDAMKGVTTALLDGQHTVEILMEHHLQNKMQNYPLLVIPEWDALLPSFKNELLAYVNNGGNLLVIGAEASALFAKESGVQLNGAPTKIVKQLGFNGKMAAVEGLLQSVHLPASAKLIGALYERQDLRADSVAAASISKYGNGRIATVYMDMGRNYEQNQSTVERDFLSALVNELFKTPMAEVKGSHLVHVAINKLDNKLIIHLINTGGPHSDKNIYLYDEVPPIGPLTITIKQRKPLKVMLEPEHRSLPFTFKDDVITLKIPSLAIHSMIVIE